MTGAPPSHLGSFGDWRQGAESGGSLSADAEVLPEGSGREAAEISLLSGLLENPEEAAVMPQKGC